MKSTIDYSKSIAPNFDAVEDIKNYLGIRYDNVAKEISKVKNPRTFQVVCSLGGIEGFPVKAWFDHFHGQGAYDREWNKYKDEISCSKNDTSHK